MKTWKVRDAVVVRTAQYESRLGLIVGQVNDSTFIVRGFNDTVVAHKSRLSEATGDDATWVSNYCPFMEPRVVVCTDPLPAAI